MEVSEVLNLVFSIALILVLLVLIWFIIELVFTVRRARETVVDVKEKLDPTLEHVEKITASLEPVVAKVDPLVERVSLTVDAANLEMMRLDQILENVGEITDTVSSAANAVDAAANVPIELVNSVTSRIRRIFKPSSASDESVALGQQKAEDAVEAASAEGATQAPDDAAKVDGDNETDNPQNHYFTYDLEKEQAGQTEKRDVHE